MENTTTASPLEQLSVETPSLPPPPMPASPFNTAHIDPNTPVTIKMPVSAFTNHRKPVSATEAPGVPARARNGIQYLAGMLDDPSKQGFVIEVQRVGPPSWEGIPLPCGPIERCMPMAYPELYRRVKESHGGGEYRIRVLDENGVMTYQFPFNIDTLIDSPKFKQANLNVPMAPRQSISGAPMPSLFAASGVTSADQELQEIRAKERLEIAAHQLTRVKREREKTERQIREEERQDQEREERMKLAPVVAAENAVKEELRQLKESLLSKGDDKVITLMLQMNKESREAAALQAERDRQANERHMQLMREAQQEAQRRSDEMMKLFMTMIQGNQSKTSDQLEIAKIQAQSQKDIMDMTLKQMQGGGSKMEKLMETVVMNKLAAPENQMEQALNLMDRGRKQTLEMLELRDKYGPDRGSDDDWNPEAGVLGNLGKMMFGFLSDAVKSGGVGLIGQWISSHLNKPANQATQQDLTRLAYGVEHNQIPAPMSNLGVQVTQNVPSNFTGSQQAQPVAPYKRPAQPVQQPVMQHVIPPTVQPEIDAPIEILELAPAQMPQQIVVPPPPVVQQPVAPPQLPVANDDAMDRLREFVSEALDIACGDLEDGRAEPEWVDFALAKWPRYFLDSLLMAPHDAARVEALKQSADPEVFQKLMLLVSNQMHYQSFMQALMGLMGEYRNRKIVPINSQAS